ncbi:MULTISPECIES: 5'/3'-nucleotidase SurE [unclassified Pseudofrankia]|uniref:5'/3'-nucleotidase SurE n=1 Tax=unclassified Pseudofrankia TaxID=2994372 RepID=UPI0009F467E3|nr:MULTISPECIES: 5'/3'-nucleotidase SurE [unclassified Pseudofrankia]MDT3440829.1 5'/3'-nucleotidase SurE [Pseudofrankia sp. BMG5.37]
MVGVWRAPARMALAAGAAGVLFVGAAACGGGDDDGAPAATTSAPVAATSAAPAPAPLTILVTNDDGVGGPGIDAVAKALAALPAVTVQVVAPTTNQSGTGGKTSPQPPAHHDATTASGTAATAVDGFPADSVNVALDTLGVKPNLVVSGINQGQNLGPVVDLSGTVGAARAAATRGIPSIATSMGLGSTYDFTQGADLVVAWVTKHRGEFTGTGSGTALASIPNLNIPNCGTAKIRGERELPTEPTLTDMSKALTNGQDCSSTETPADEVAAFNVGFATLTSIPVKPAS